jgi:multiple sugar transport system substrate-binding protein
VTPADPGGRRFLRRVAAAALAVAALAAAAAACGSSSTSSPAAGAPVQITMWHYNVDAEGRATKELVDRFNATHPGIHVTAQFSGNSDYALEKVLTAIAGGKYPDVVYLYGSWMANIAKSPKVVALNDLIAKDKTFDWNDFWPAERLAATVNGKVVGVPAMVDNLAIVYNKKLFDQAGVAYPSASWTWDDLRAAAKALTDPPKTQFGWAFPADGSEDTVWHWEAMLWDYGGDILNADNTKAAFNSPQGVQALSILGDMATVDKSVYVDTSNSKIQSLFNGGRIAMLVTGPWDLTGFPNIDYGVQVLPANHQTISGPDNWVLLDNGPARVAATWQFISWFTAAEQNMYYALNTSVLPIRRSEMKLPDYPAYVAKYPGVGTFVANMSQAVKARPVVPQYAKISSALGQAIVAVLLGKSDATTALAQAAQQTDALLAVPAQ